MELGDVDQTFLEDWHAQPFGGAVWGYAVSETEQLGVTDLTLKS